MVYLYHRDKLNKDESDDLTDDQGKPIMQEWIANKRMDRMMSRTYNQEVFILPI